MEKDEVKLGLYYSAKQDAVIELFKNARGDLAHIYAQWCPPGTWSRTNTEGNYYFNFGGSFASDGQEGRHNFKVFWDEYEPEYVGEISYLEFIEMIMPMLQEEEEE